MLFRRLCGVVTGANEGAVLMTLLVLSVQGRSSPEIIPAGDNRPGGYSIQSSDAGVA